MGGRGGEGGGGKINWWRALLKRGWDAGVEEVKGRGEGGLNNDACLLGLKDNEEESWMSHGLYSVSD